AASSPPPPVAQHAGVRERASVVRPCWLDRIARRQTQCGLALCTRARVPRLLIPRRAYRCARGCGLRRNLGLSARPLPESVCSTSKPFHSQPYLLLVRPRCLLRRSAAPLDRKL